MDSQYTKSDETTTPSADSIDFDARLMQKQSRKLAVISLIMLIVSVIVVWAWFVIYENTIDNGESPEALMLAFFMFLPGMICGGVGFFVGIVAAVIAVKYKFSKKNGGS